MMTSVSRTSWEVSQLQSQLAMEVAQFQHKNRLTDIELLQALNMAEETVLKFALRYERHGNYDTPANLETNEAPEVAFHRFSVQHFGGDKIRAAQWIAQVTEQ